MEIWKPVSLTLFSEHYEVSSLGRLRRITPSKRNKYAHILKGEKTVKGYIRVHLVIPGAKRRIFMHVLAAEAFLGKAAPGCQVNHRDGCKENNRIDNLEWVTCAENVQHSFRSGLRQNPKGESHPCAKLTNADVRAISEARNSGATLQQIATVYGISKTHVSYLVNKKSWRHLI